MQTEDTNYHDNWIITHTGKKFYPFALEPGMIDIRDIAHALSLNCRFGGHCQVFYSVAQHSILLSHWMWKEYELLTEHRKELAKWALLHDASEAYLVDIPRPVKKGLPDYKELEDKIMRSIAEKFNLSWPIPDLVKSADVRLLASECRWVLLGSTTLTEPDLDLPQPLDIAMPDLGKHPTVVEAEFLHVFRELTR